MAAEIKVRSEIVSLTNPQDSVELANTLAKIIMAKGLSVQLTPKSKKRYVMVEGWQLAGALCGIYPIVENVENLSDDKRICYRAEVTLRNQEDEIVGTGMAICTNQEKGKEQFGEYAICSMAQTRAVGKAFRLKLGWIMKLAGFQATPCEEVGEDGSIEEVAEEVAIDQTDYAEELVKAKDAHELYKVWLRVPNDQRAELISIKDEMKVKLATKEEAK